MKIGGASFSLTGCFRPGLISGLVLTLTCVWLIFAGIAYESYRAEWQSQETFGSNLAALIGQSIARNEEVYDLSIQAAAEDSLNPAIMSLPGELMRKTLFDQSANASGLGAMLVLDKNGRVVTASKSSVPANYDLSDRDYFVAQRDGLVTKQPFVSRPFQSRITHNYVFAFSRPRRTPDGAFDGVVAGTMTLDYFSRLFDMVHLPPSSTIMLIRTDGIVLMRAPLIDGEVGAVLRSPSVTTGVTTSSFGSYVKPSVFDGVKRLFAYRQVGDLPIYLTVGLSLDQFLRGWLIRISIIGIGFVVLSVVIISLGIMLARELRRRTDAEQSLYKLALTDGLTLLANRRRFDDSLDREWARAIREGTTLSIVMIDGDYFKAYNDTYGHPRGDEVLRLLAAALVTCVDRPADLVARFGGEEFVILLPCTESAGAIAVAEEVQRAVIGLGIPNVGSPLGLVTVSAGIASRAPSVGASALGLVEAADRALYAAKAEGRNRIKVEEAFVPARISTASSWVL